MLLRMVFCFCLITIVSALIAQDTCNDYPCVIEKIKTAIDSANYDIAFDNLESASAYTESNPVEISDLRKLLFDRINEEKKRAIIAEEEAKRLLSQTEKEKKRADKQSGIAQEEKRKAESFVRASLNVALANEVSKIDPTLALNIMEYNVSRHKTDESSKGNYKRFLEYSRKIVCERVFDSDTAVGEIIALAISRNGKRCFIGTENAITIWDLERNENKIIRQEIHKGLIDVTPDATTYLYAENERKLILFNSKDDFKKELELKRDISTLAISIDGSFGVVGTDSSFLYQWVPRENNTQLYNFGYNQSENPAHFDIIEALDISSDGAFVLSGSADRTARLWRIANLSTIQAFLDHTKMVNAVAISPKGQTVITSGLDYNIKLWEAETGKLITSIGLGEEITTIQFSPDGKSFFTASPNGTGRLWDLVNGRLIEEYPEIKAPIAVSDNYIISGSPDGNVRLWNIRVAEANCENCKGYSSTLEELWHAGVYLEPKDLVKIGRSRNKIKF